MSLWESLHPTMLEWAEREVKVEVRMLMLLETAG